MTMDGIFLRFKVTLHVNQTDLDPTAVTAALRLQPSCQYRKGDPRRFRLQGVYPNGHWSHRFDLTGVRDLFGYLDELLRGWEKQPEFFNHLADSGGEALLFCGIIADGNWDEQISHAMAGRLASLKIDLRLDTWMRKPDAPVAAEKPLGA